MAFRVITWYAVISKAQIRLPGIYTLGFILASRLHARVRRRQGVNPIFDLPRAGLKEGSFGSIVRCASFHRKFHKISRRLIKSRTYDPWGKIRRRKGRKKIHGSLILHKRIRSSSYWQRSRGKRDAGSLFNATNDVNCEMCRVFFLKNNRVFEENIDFFSFFFF